MSDKHEDGGPAFGVRTVSSTYIPNGAAGAGQTATETHSTGGLSLRDYFAAKALPMSASAFAEGHQDGQLGIARHAYQWADAMIEARKS